MSFVDRAFGGNSTLLRLLSTAANSVIIAVLLVLAGCGGSANLGGGLPPGFRLSVSGPGVYVSSVIPGSVTVGVTGFNGFNSTVSIAFSGVPSGVTVSPATATLPAGQSQQFTFTASNAATSNSQVTVTGTLGSTSQQVELQLQVRAYSAKAGLSRTHYARTDAVLPYTVIFDSASSRFFMSDPGSNQIFVLDASTRKLIGSIVVPGAYGMDETPDHSVLYAGTQVGDVYAIDPVKMLVTHRYIASAIGSNGFQAYVVQVLANGELALLGGQGGDPSINGYSAFALWNPVSNAIQTYGSGHAIRSCADEGYIFTFTVTGDRSLLVLQNEAISGPGANEVCTLDPVTGQKNYLNITGSPVTPTPDGKSILVLVYGLPAQLVVLDAHTLEQTAAFPVGDAPSGTLMVVSADSSTLYLAPELGGIVTAYDVSSGAQLGWLPDLYTSPIGTWISATDNTGLLAGVNVEGIGFLDAAAMQTGPVGTAFLGGSLTPATGPVSGGTSVNTYFSSSMNLAAVYFGQNPATAITEPSSQLYATTPPGALGPADVVSIMSDGSTDIAPEAFSYGPTILEVTPEFSTAEGGGTGMIYGYGFGPNPSNQIPQGLQVSVAGQPVQITNFNPQGYTSGSAPTPLQSVSYVIPPGIAGNTADVQLTSSSGSATANAAISYLPATQQFPAAAGAVLAHGVYDRYRDVYYFTDADKIQVFSKTQAQWLPPINIPAANGVTQRLWGIALSPDGTKLAVADVSAGVIYELNPTNPSQIQTFPVSSTSLATVEPVCVAISDAGMIYYATYAPSVSGAHGFYKLNTSTGAITDYGITSPGLSSDTYLHTAISSDNSRVFFNQDGAVFLVKTSNDSLTFASTDPTCCYGDYDLTLSSGQSTLEATSYLYDTNLNAASYLVLSDRDADGISYVYGTQLSADGTLLFQPSTNGIDVYDGRLGTLRSRVALPFTLSQNYDALVGDGKDNVLIAITGSKGSGIAIIDLTSLMEPAPLPYALPILDGASTQGAAAIDPAAAQRQSGIARDRHLRPKLRVPHVYNRIALSTPAFQQRRTVP